MAKKIFQNNLKNILRLAMILCFVQLYISIFTPHLRENRAETAIENGVGGGSVVEAEMAQSLVFLESEGELRLSDQALFELGGGSGVPEPEVFSRSRMLSFDTYTVKKGDLIGYLAEAFGLNQDTLISVNGIKNTRLLQIGKVLRIPNQDGIYHTVRSGETLASIAGKYNSDPDAIRIANELFTDSSLAGTNLFIPGARLDSVNLQEINGDLFTWPVSGHISSSYGYRTSPFTGSRQFHSGLDISAPTGTPVRAGMSGRVSATGYDASLGNYAVISHHSGYRTLYAHMSLVRVKSGAYVGTGERIGDVGNTGLSTGPHLHFTVYKNGITVNPRTLMK